MDETVNESIPESIVAVEANEKKPTSQLILDAKKGFWLVGRLLLLSFLSFGILFPLAYYQYTCDLVENTVLDGRKLRFTGQAKTVYQIVCTGLLSIALLWGLEYLLKLVITGETELKYLHKVIGLLTSLFGTVFIKIRLIRWRQSNTHFEGEAGESRLRMDLLRCAEVGVVGWALGLLSALVVAAPFFYYLKRDYMVNRMEIDGEPMLFSGRLKEPVNIFYQYLIPVLLTAGILLPRLWFKLLQWDAASTHLASTPGYSRRKQTPLEKLIASQQHKNSEAERPAPSQIK